MNPDRNPSDNLLSSGSSSHAGIEFLVVGKLRAPHGVHGELMMEVITDFPERLHPGIQLYIGENHRSYRLRSLRAHAKGLLVAFDGLETPEAAGVLRNHLVYVSTSSLPPLAEGEYYHHELIGLDVFSDEGSLLGKLVEIMDTAANDVYVVRPQIGADLLLPAIESVILNIDLAAGRITVHLLPGLL